MRHVSFVCSALVISGVTAVVLVATSASATPLLAVGQTIDGCEKLLKRGAELFRQAVDKSDFGEAKKHLDEADGEATRSCNAASDIYNYRDEGNTPLSYVIEKSASEAAWRFVGELLSHYHADPLGMAVNDSLPPYDNTTYRSPLYLAVTHGRDPKLIGVLLDGGAPIEPGLVDLAFERGHPSSGLALIDFGASVTCRAPSAGVLDVRDSLLTWAKKRDREKPPECTAPALSPFREIGPLMGRHESHYLAMTEDADAIRTAVENIVGGLGLKDSLAITPFHLLAAFGDYATVAELVEDSSLVPDSVLFAKTTYAKTTPLTMAARYNRDHRVVRLLACEGANRGESAKEASEIQPDCRSISVGGLEGENYLWSAFYRDGELRSSFLRAAALSQKPQSLEKNIITTASLLGWNPLKTDELERNAFHWAAIRIWRTGAESDWAMEVLVCSLDKDRGSPIDHKDFAGKTPRHFLVNYEQMWDTATEECRFLAHAIGAIG